MFFQNCIKKKIVQGAISLFCSLSPVMLTAEPMTTNQKTHESYKPSIGWKEFHSSSGQCSMLFPAVPEHISEKMTMPDEGFEVKYDAYISAADPQTIFMLLVAKYPDFVDEVYAQMSLEGFLNAVLTHNPNNQLLFADLLLVDGHEALDFFIRAGDVYFKGRAMMVKNSLYLMAMECQIPNYDENRYKHFVSSFKLHPVKSSTK